MRSLGPNFYAAVMGTAIVANAGQGLAKWTPSLHAFAVVVWALSLVMLAVLQAVRVVQLVRYPGEVRRQLLNPAVAVFYGCPPMAMLAVGYGTLAAGTSAIGASAALDIDVVLWTVGALYGLATAVGVPYLLITRREASNADPTWLLPIVPPMVAAALGPVVAAHLPAGPDRETLLFACYAMFGASLMATLVVLPGIWRRLVQDKLDSLTMTPTLFLVLGPLGQSVTAAYQISHVAGTGDQYAILYGVPVMGFALLWLVLAGIANVRALRRGMPFAMTWWAYTFPVGTCVTGAIGLARLTGLDAFTGLSFALYVLLVVAWAVAGGRTLAGTVSGRLLRPAVPVMD